MNIENQYFKHDPYSDENINKQIVGFIQQTRDQKTKEDPQQRPPHFYYLTVTYNEPPATGNGPALHDDPAKVVQFALGKVQKVLNHLNNRLVEDHYDKTRRKRLRPVYIAGLDFSGSREGKTNLQKFPHAHIIVVVPARTHDRFLKLVDKDFALSKHIPNTASIQNIHCLPIQDKQRDIYKVTSYTTKFLRTGYSKMLGPDLRNDCLIIQ